MIRILTLNIYHFGYYFKTLVFQVILLIDSSKYAFLGEILSHFTNYYTLIAQTKIMQPNVAALIFIFFIVWFDGKRISLLYALGPFE